MGGGWNGPARDRWGAAFRPSWILAGAVGLSIAAAAGGRSAEASPLNSCINAVKDFNAAVRLCTAVIESDGATSHDKALAYAFRAYARWFADHSDSSGQERADLRQAVKLDPNIAEAYYVGGAIYEAQYQYAVAARDFDRSVELNFSIPTFLESAYYLRGVSHQILFTVTNDPSQCVVAIQSFKMAIALGDTDKSEAVERRTKCENSIRRAAGAERESNGN